LIYWRPNNTGGEPRVKFGIFDHVDDAGVPLQQLYEERCRIAEAYDRGGFHAYHLAEHHVTPLGAAASPGLLLAAMAYRTKRLRLGPMVYLLPFYHPLRLIEEVCMLDQMTGGRLQLGIGRGVSRFETAAYALDFEKTQAMYHECFQVLLKGLSSDELNFQGEFYRFENQPMVLKPVQRPHPPLWYGITLPQNAEWPAANDVNVISLGLRETTAIAIAGCRERCSASAAMSSSPKPTRRRVASPTPPTRAGGRASAGCLTATARSLASSAYIRKASTT
jgi:alkanesulfonate monooxygenase SsuD/methylene tetrahydromethanopterin reductase-like flavin-dependent oxidoreductase (luciferase family)